MLVGLSVTVTSVALAAPPAPASADPKPVLVAQNKGETRPATKSVQDPTPTEGGGTAPTTAPAPASEPAPSAADSTTQPAITIGSGTGTPASDTPATAAEDPTKKPKPRPFAGTQVFAQVSTSTATIFRGQQQDYNPTVDSAIYLQPRYALSEAFQLRGRLVFNYEFTNSDTTATRNEPRFSDTTLQLFYRKLPMLPGDIKPMIAANLGLPTSSESRARTMVVSPGATLQLSKPVEHVLGGELLFLVSAAYSHPIYRRQTPEIRGSAPYSFSCAGGNNCSDQLSGTFNTSDSLSYTAMIAGEWGKWSPALFYLGSSSWAYQGSATNPVDGTPLQSPNGFSSTNVRQASYFSAWLDYNANSWLTAEVGYSLFRTALDEDGTRGNPIFGRYQDMRVYLGANFNIDNIMKQLEGGPTDAGIVRAKNTRQPFWNF
jgi:hypothetical protein